MSYCHLLGGAYGNIALTFGLGFPYGVNPERVPSRMRDHVVRAAQSYPNCLSLVPPTPPPTSAGTATPTPTLSSTPTFTPTATLTPTATRTPTNTPTETPTPPPSATPTATLTTTPTATLAPQCALCGDISGNGNVDIMDSLFISQYTVLLRTTVPCPALGDVDGNGQLDIVDALFISQHTVDLRPQLTCLSGTPAATVTPTSTAPPG